jgi:hypothetical protein
MLHERKEIGKRKTAVVASAQQGATVEAGQGMKKAATFPNHDAF